MLVPEARSRPLLSLSTPETTGGHPRWRPLQKEFAQFFGLLAKPGWALRFQGVLQSEDNGDVRKNVAPHRDRKVRLQPQGAR